MAEQYWWKKAQIYELYIDKFAGTIRGLIEKLDYLDALGINALHILPHYPSPMVDGGYDVMDYLNVRPELGTLEDFDDLVREAHVRGMKIMVDCVLNHVSEHHPWFIDARGSRISKKRDFFLWSNTGKEFASTHNPFSDIKPSNWIRNDGTSDFYFASFYPQQPDLNWDNPHVYEAMISNMDFWAERGIDGFRLDAVAYFVKREGTTSRGLPETHTILKRIRKHFDSKFQGKIGLLGETHQKSSDMRAYFGNNDECQMLYHFPLMEQFFVALMRNDTSGIKHMVDTTYNIPPSCQWVTFLRNHDEISLATLAEDDRRELVHFLDPDHQFPFNGGKTTSMRLGSIFAGKPARILSAFELLYSIPGTHVMYYGDEIGMQNLPATPGIIDTRTYVRGEFDWREEYRQEADPTSLYNRTSQIIKKSHWPWR